MANESESFDAEKFFDDKGATPAATEEVAEKVAVEQTPPAQDQEPELKSDVQDSKEAEPQPSAELKAEEKPAEAETESAIEKLLVEQPEKEEVEPVKGDGKTVPLEDHIKLRRRAQVAEAELAEVEAELEEIHRTQTVGAKTGEGETPLETELSNLDDEEPLTVGQARKLLAEQKRTADEKREQSLVRRRAAIIVSRAINSETEFKANTPDYDKVTGAVLKANLLTNNDRKKIIVSDNPAKTYYELSKAKLDALKEAITGQTAVQPESKKTEPAPKPIPKKEPKAEDNPASSDEELFNSIFEEAPSA